MGEMENNKEQKYFELLSKGFLDKVWFLGKLEPCIDTLVDFGCGDGSLSVIIDRVFPGKYRYIGIDNNPDVLSEAQAQGLEVYSSLSELPEIDYGRSAIILNSVLHEVFSFSAFGEAYALLEEMESKKFRHVAIRDMCLNRKDKLPNYTKEIMDSSYADAFRSFLEKTPTEIYPDIADYKVLALEFMLKYLYADESAKSKVYLWRWHAHIPDIFSGYVKEFDSTCRVPWTIRQIRKDFGIDLQFDTHRKMLLTRI